MATKKKLGLTFLYTHTISLFFFLILQQDVQGICEPIHLKTLLWQSEDGKGNRNSLRNYPTTILNHKYKRNVFV